MSQQPVTYHQVTVAEAAGILGVSTMTVRRMIRRGQLEGERVVRPQGSAYVVRLPGGNTAGDTDATASEQPSPNVSRTNATGQASAPELMAAWSETFLAPIMARMAEQETTIREQAEVIGRQAAELDALRAAQRPIEARTATHPPDPTLGPPQPAPAPSAPWWRRWLSAAYGW